LQTFFCTTERDEELLTPIMGILGVFVALVKAEGFTGDGLTCFFLTIFRAVPNQWQACTHGDTWGTEARQEHKHDTSAHLERSSNKNDNILKFHQEHKSSTSFFHLP
jgi:hypothetical protein